MATAVFCTECNKFNPPGTSECLACGAYIPPTPEFDVASEAREAAAAHDGQKQDATILGLLLVPILVLLGWLFWPESEPARTSRPTVTRDLAEQRQQEFLWMEEAKDQIRTRLKDPDSARFGRTFIRRYSGAPLVCGFVNAKNSFGGYGGEQRFIFAGSAGMFLEEEMAAGEMDKSWSEFCRG